jgi:AraC-like DNA-binding protein
LNNYESHAFVKSDFPMIFHLDEIPAGRSSFSPHWHENPELLCFIEGSGVVHCDAEQVHARAGELVIVNSNQLHAVYTAESSCRYYCLIPSSAFLAEIALPVEQVSFERHLDARAYLPYFESLYQETQAAGAYYKTLCTGVCVQLMSRLAREHAHFFPAPSPGKMERVKVGMIYLRENFREPISVEAVCAAAGLSKYYFCHLFREYTGMSVIQYLNRLRCEEARRLLASGQYNVSQSALLSGFNNLSYFTRTYVKQMGRLPSQEG